MRFKFLVPTLLASVVFTLGTVGIATAGEHPEHPTKEKKAEHPEHPEHPEDHAAPAEVTMKALGDAIEKYVAWDSKLHGGYLIVHDPVAKTQLALKLDKVHRERLSSLGNGVYFACADFKATDGTVYDLDVFMEAAESSPFNGLWPTEIAVHKKNGEARYTWQEKDGVWTKKSAK